MKRKRIALFASVFSLAAVSMIGCDGDGAPPASEGGKKKDDPEGDSGGGKKAKKPAGKGGKSTAPTALKTYPKIKEEFRRELKERDFRPDPMGDENRDPFFSFLLQSPRVAATAGTQSQKDLCADREWRANTTSVRELKLMAIVLQGTRSWAQFRDKGSMGHIVERGFCIGKEKAVVDHIGDNFVRLKITPEAPPGAATPEPVLEDFALYPATMDLKENSDSSE